MGGRRLGALALLILAAFTPPPLPAPPAADGAGNWSLPFEPVRPATPNGANLPARHCTADRAWCAGLSREDESGQWGLDILEGASAAARRLVLSGQEMGDASFSMWSRITLEAGGAVLIGVQRTRSTSFSGGGASTISILLVRVGPGTVAAAEVLEAPMIGRATIRACFGPRDERARAGACHDEYELAGNLLLDLETRAGRPRFILTASARTYPGRVSRSEDSTRAPPLRRRDLVWASDPACTYRRAFAFDPAAGRYLPGAPLPECGDYLDIGD